MVKTIIKYVPCLLILITTLLYQCDQPKQPAAPRPTPPDGWTEKVNNERIAGVQIPQVSNCATGAGRNVDCAVDTMLLECCAVVTYTDGDVVEITGLCDGQTLIFDDGEFSYFYGTQK